MSELFASMFFVDVVKFTAYTAVEMGRAALSEEQVSRFREQIVTVATRLFASRGYEGVTMRALAAELGCSPMTPYRYFRDREAIFAAARTAAYDDFSSAQRTSASAQATPAERLLALGRAYVRFALEHPHAYRLMFGLGQPDPDGFPDLRLAELGAWSLLRRTIGEAVSAGALRGDPAVLAHIFWAGVHGLVSLYLAGKLVFGTELDELVEPMLQTLFRGNLPESSMPQIDRRSSS